MSPHTLLAFIVAALAGAIGHELAHWLVWRVTGREPRFDVIGLQVCPQAGPRRTTAGDRVSAAAPYLIGAVAVVSGLLWFGVVWVVFGVAMIQIPSGVDVATMLGRTQWRLDQASG